MKEQLLYKDLANYYDLIYSYKNYKKESDKLIELIDKNKKSNGKELLEVACGTGKHLQYFSKRFKCTGIDINKEVLAIAWHKLKEVMFHHASMINFNLNKEFDVITCLFSSIGYVKTYDNLKRTISNFSKHLKVGGVVIIEPWFTKKTYKEGAPHISTYQDENIKIARLNVSKVLGNLSIMDMHFLIAERNKDTKHFVDRHELGLFEQNKTLYFMKENGLKAVYLKNGLLKDRGLFMGVKK